MRIGLPVKLDYRAVLRSIDAGNDLDQRAFARAVFTRQAMHLAWQDVEADTLQGPDATERHVDVAQGQKRLLATLSAFASSHRFNL